MDTQTSTIIKTRDTKFLNNGFCILCSSLFQMLSTRTNAPANQ